MSYLYYPGCSAKSTGKPYEESMLEVFKELEIPLEELEDWNCCGATNYMAINELKAFTLSARNFALAERQHQDRALAEIVAPCAACYLGLLKAQKYLTDYPEIRAKVCEGLHNAGLNYVGRVKVRHPLEILVKDYGLEKLSSRAKKSLEGYRVACYYGCQLVRPYSEFDDQHKPHTMDDIVEALGAQAVDWPLKTRCCGGSLTGTIQMCGLRLVAMLLNEAIKRGCNVIATACPLCQFNLECYQKIMNKKFGYWFKVPVVFFTQLVGVALGIDKKKLGLNRLFLPLPDPAEAAVCEIPQSVQTKISAGGSHVSK
jgi:heterodisulfide reductase subunit B